MIFKPVAEFTSKTADKFGDAIENGDNKILKNVKELGKTTVNATGYRKYFINFYF